MNTIIEDSRKIGAIKVKDSISGYDVFYIKSDYTYTNGLCVDEIVVCKEPGAFCYLTFFAIVKNNEVIYRVNCRDVSEISYLMDVQTECEFIAKEFVSKGVVEKGKDVIVVTGGKDGVDVSDLRNIHMLFKKYDIQITKKTSDISNGR